MTKHMPQLPKTPTGIRGLDEITNGGLPAGRATLVCGGAGCGKTLLAVEFLVRGITQFHEPGVLLTFEESAAELAENVASLGFDLPALVRRRQLLVDQLALDRREMIESGEYDLQGLFLRLGHAIDSAGAKRVVLDAFESLFGKFSDESILRAELQRLFRWLKTKGVTTIITGEQGNGSLTRHGLEEYVSDCVLALDHRVQDQITTRRMRVVKYRGSTHGTNEYPFLIDAEGVSVIPVTSLGLDHPAPTERVSSGIPQLDEMLGGKGYYRGSSILISGTAGSGKSSVVAHYADAACRRGERVLYFAFEESHRQIVRNMRSLGINLEQWVRRKRLEFHMARPTLYGLEMHLATMYHAIEVFKPTSVIVDPVTNLLSAGNELAAQSMLLRLVDMLKANRITALLTSLTAGGKDLEATDAGVSSLIDTWLLLRDNESGGERNRALYLLKSRGMAHSNQVREFRLTDRGLRLENVYTGPQGVLVGSARLAQQARDRAGQLAQRNELQRKQYELERRVRETDAELAGLRAELEGKRGLPTATVARPEPPRLAPARVRRASRQRGHTP